MKFINTASLASLFGLAFLIVAGCSSTSTITKTSADGPDSAAKSARFKPYAKVITKEAISTPGLFSVHRIGEKIFFEIPVSRLNQEYLLVSRISKTPQVGYGGEELNTSVIKWERKFDKILLRTVSYENVAPDTAAIYRAVQAANFGEIIEAFPIQAFSTDSQNVVINVTGLFTDDVSLLTPGSGIRKQYKISRLFKERSYVDYVRSFPANIEIENVLTFAASEPPQNPSSQVMSFSIHHSMVELPQKPMIPRLADPRVGYFSLWQTDYGRPEPEAVTRRYILRWRLEPSDTAAFLRGELVEPIKPITYYIDPATPYQWRPWLKKGIESWNPAFEKAGFKNAVRVLDPPSPEEDSTWSAEDARYSVIRYYPSPIENAYGPNIHDPRTGEIIESDIGWYHNILKLQTGWFFAQAVSDPRSHTLPYPDSLMGELIATVAAHEFGHTIGLPHNMGASSAYPVDSLRSKTFCAKYGTAPSIMDYARYNYIAQPADDVDVFPKVGPYDDWSVFWGYRPIIGATTSDDELDSLHAWATAAEADPYKRFGGQQWMVFDPTSQMEDLGDDPMKAGEYGIANLKRAMGYVYNATYKNGTDFKSLSESVDDIWAQFSREVGHVANVPGGVVVSRRVFGSTSPISYTPVSRTKQKAAVAWLGTHLVKTPLWLLDSSITSILNPITLTEKLASVQTRYIRTAMSNDKLVRMLSLEAQNQAPYKASELLADIESLVFSQDFMRSPDYYQRNMQRDFVEALIAKTEKTDISKLGEWARYFFVDVYATDVRSLARTHLSQLEKKLQGAGTDAFSKGHFADLRLQIQRALAVTK